MNGWQLSAVRFHGLPERQGLSRACMINTASDPEPWPERALGNDFFKTGCLRRPSPHLPGQSASRHAPAGLRNRGQRANPSFVVGENTATVSPQGTAALGERPQRRLQSHPSSQAHQLNGCDGGGGRAAAFRTERSRLSQPATMSIGEVVQGGPPNLAPVFAGNDSGGADKGSSIKENTACRRQEPPAENPKVMDVTLPAEHRAFRSQRNTVSPLPGGAPSWSE